MKLRAKESAINLTEAIEPSSARLLVWSNGDGRENPDSFLMTAVRVAPDEIRGLDPEQRELIGAPTMFAIELSVDHGQRILLHPTPDRDLDAIFGYCPAYREI